MYVALAVALRWPFLARLTGMVEANFLYVTSFGGLENPTEYGGSKFAAYFFAEYVNILVVSGLAVTLFLGGWQLPFIDPPGFFDPFVVLGKMFLFVFLFVWIRATLPRLRYDQLMSFGWKDLLPLATLNALVTAVVVVAVS